MICVELLHSAQSSILKTYFMPLWKPILTVYMTLENLLGPGYPGSYEILSWVAWLYTNGKPLSEERTGVSCSKFVAIGTKKHPFPPRTSYYHYLIGPDAVELISHIWKHKATYTCKNKRIWKEYFCLRGNLICVWLSHANPEMFFLTNSLRKLFDHIKSNNNYECFLIAVQLMRNLGLLTYSTAFVWGVTWVL